MYSNAEFVRKGEGAQAQRNFNSMELEMLEEKVDFPSVKLINKENNSWN